MISVPEFQNFVMIGWVGETGLRRCKGAIVGWAVVPVRNFSSGIVVLIVRIFVRVCSSGARQLGDTTNDRSSNKLRYPLLTTRNAARALASTAAEIKRFVNLPEESGAKRPSRPWTRLSGIERDLLSDIGRHYQI